MRDPVPAQSEGGRQPRRHSGIELNSFAAGPTRRAGQFVGKRYRIERRLGTGSTSDVFLSVDTRQGRPVVVKQLTANAQANPELKARFLAEARALGELRHPNIVHLLDYGAPEGERPYLVMEVLQGETLARLLSRRHNLPVETALLIARKTAEGLDYAHRVGVIHRDIKPDNLYLLGPEGAPFGVKIIDFGMAKLPGSLGSSGMHTVLGTVEYMSPEQVMADPVDGRTDVYALGIVLFRMLTGHLPFMAEDGIDLLSHQLFSPVPPASWICEDLDPALDRLVQKATRKHPANRHPGMTDFLLDLNRAVESDGSEVDQSLSPAVEPDVYEPQNVKGREAAEALAERYAANCSTSE